MATESLDSLTTYLTALAKRIEDPRALEPAYRQCAAIATEGMREHFSRSRGPDGKGWKPLKQRKGKPLVKTGFLLASVKATAGPQGLVLSATADYAGPQHHGTRHIPARPFVGASAATLGRIVAALESHAAAFISGGASHG